MKTIFANSFEEARKCIRDLTGSACIKISSDENGEDPISRFAIKKFVDELHFYRQDILVSLDLSETKLKKVYCYDFEGCRVLESIILPECLEEINECAFCDCTSLKELSIPSSVKRIGPFAYDKKSGKRCDVSLEKVIIHDGLKELEENVFCACSSLKAVEIPSSVTKIGKNAFYGCINLDDVKLNEGLQEIVDGAFGYCRALKSIDIPITVSSIEGGAFCSCSSLESIRLPMGLKKISESMFADCSSLKSITIPSSVENIEWNAFGGCTSLKSLNIPSSVKSIGNIAFCGCSSLESICIPEGITSINQYLFDNCFSLVEVLLPSTIERIESGAFAGCTSLPKISIPSACTYIGNYAFLKCSALKSAVFESKNNWYANKNLDINLYFLDDASQTAKYLTDESYDDMKISNIKYEWIKRTV